MTLTPVNQWVNTVFGEHESNIWPVRQTITYIILFKKTEFTVKARQHWPFPFCIFYYRLPQMSAWARSSCSDLFGVRRQKVEHSVEPVRYVVCYEVSHRRQRTLVIRHLLCSALLWQPLINNVLSVPTPAASASAWALILQQLLLWGEKRVFCWVFFLLQWGRRNI